MQQKIFDVVTANASHVAASFDSTFVLVAPNGASPPAGAVALRKCLMAQDCCGCKQVFYTDTMGPFLTRNK
jgi:hypothetical protein